MTNSSEPNRIREIRPHPKKSWSQNFLTDRHVCSRIADETALAAEGRPVLELGAGTGALTRELASRFKKVWALERDRELVPLLKKEFAGNAQCNNVEVLEDNALTVDIRSLAGTISTCDHGMIVVGNLPYHIASGIIFHLLDQRDSISSFILMLQREMAERIVSGPGSREYGVISVLCAMHVKTRILFRVKPTSFKPKPKVESAIVRFDVLEKPAVDVDEAMFRKVVKAAFSQRRKTLRNSLAQLFEDGTTVLKVLDEAGIDPGRRAETLSVEEFARITGNAARLISEVPAECSTIEDIHPVGNL